MRIELFRARDLQHLALFFHHAVPGKLCLGNRPGYLGAMPSWQSIIGSHVAGDLGSDTKPDFTLAHFLQGQYSLAAIQVIGLTHFTITYLVNGQRKITIPFDRIHRNI